MSRDVYKDDEDPFDNKPAPAPAPENAYTP